MGSDDLAIDARFHGHGGDRLYVADCMQAQRHRLFDRLSYQYGDGRYGFLGFGLGATALVGTGVQ
jgi:hypothetical protein